MQQEQHQQKFNYFMKLRQRKVVELQLKESEVKQLLFTHEDYNNIQVMPFKLKLIKNFQKCLVPQQSQAVEEEKCLDFACTQSHNKTKAKNRKMIKKTTNFFQMVLMKQPIKEKHIVNFFNILTINQDAVRSQHCQESYFRTLFYTKTVRKVEERPYCLVFSLADSELQFPKLQYTIQRFKSFGDQKFYQLALLMEHVEAKLKELQNYKGKNPHDLNNDQVDAYVDSLRNRMFCCKTENKWFLSKSLLELLQYDVESFAIELIKYRASFHEYRQNDIEHALANNTIWLCSLINLLLDRISLETFLDNSIVRFKDCLFTKSNKRIFGKIKTGMPNPFLTIFEVQEVISQSEDFEVPSYFTGHRKKQMNQMREQIREQQFKSLRYIAGLPKNYYSENKGQMAGYVDNMQVCKEEAE